MYHQALIEYRVPIANADRSDKMLDVLISVCHHHQAFKEEHERQHIFLIIYSNKGTSEFDRLRQNVFKLRFEFEQGVGVETFDAFMFDDVFTNSESVATHEAVLFLIP